MSSIGSEKAYFINDDGGATFYVQFNPKEMKLDESAAWKESKEFQVDKPLVEFDRGKASSLTMELIFDTTDTGDDVRERWTSKLAGFVAVTVGDEDNVHKAVRPPRCTFNWGSFSFPAVIEKVSTSFIMFASNGNPLRAKVSITLKERNEEQGGTGAGPGVTLSAPVSAFGGRSNSRTESAKISAKSGDGQSAATQDTPGVGTNATQTASGFTGVSTYTVQEGDTLSGIALFLSIEFWWIAAANNIDDPMNLTPGDTLVIPPSQQCAEIFQHLPPEDNWYWGDYDPQLNPDSDLADIFAIYDGEWDPFAEQELEDLGAETALEVGVGDQVSGDWAMSEYEGNAPDATEFVRPDAVDSSFERIGREGDGAQAMEAGPAVTAYEGDAPDATEFERPDAVDSSFERIGSEGDGAQGVDNDPGASGAQGDGAQAMEAGPGVSGYDGDRPDETEFEHGESGSSDVFSVYAPADDDEQGGAAAAAGGGGASTRMERPSDPAPAASNESAPSESSTSAAASAPSEAPPQAAVKVDAKKAVEDVLSANRNRGSDNS